MRLDLGRIRIPEYLTVSNMRARRAALAPRVEATAELQELGKVIARDWNDRIDVERLARAFARAKASNHSPEEAEEHWRSYEDEAKAVVAEYGAIRVAEPTPEPHGTGSGRSTP